MDEYIHSFSESLQNHMRGANEEESEWVKDQLTTALSNIMSSRNASQNCPSSNDVLHSHRISSVNVLTANSSSQYNHKSMGIGGVRYRRVSRLSHNSIISDSNMAKVAAKCRQTHRSTTVTIAAPKDIQSKSFKRKLFGHSSATSTPVLPSGTRPLPVRKRPPPSAAPPLLKDVEIKLTKIDISGIPRPSVPHPPISSTANQNEAISSDTSGFNDGTTVPENMYPTTGYDTSGDLECGSPSLLATKDGFESRIGTQAGVLTHDDQNEIRSEDGNGPGDINFLPPNPELQFSSCGDVSDGSEINIMDVSSADDANTTNQSRQEKELRNENQSEENENTSDESENQSIEESGNLSEKNENLSPDYDKENQSEEENWIEHGNESPPENENQSVHESSNVGNEFWFVVDEDVDCDLQPYKLSPPPQAELPLKYQCCGCGKTIYRSVDLICFNYRLELIICETCFKSMIKGSFTVEDGHEIYCSVCGDGGHLVLCDTCEKSICQDCVKRFIGEEALQKILTDHNSEWSCFSCDSNPIISNQLQFREFQEAKEEEGRRGRLRRPISFKEKEVASLKNRRKRKQRAPGSDSDSALPLIKKRITGNATQDDVFTGGDNNDGDCMMLDNETTSDDSINRIDGHTVSISNSSDSSVDDSGRGLKGSTNVLAGINLLRGTKAKRIINGRERTTISETSDDDDDDVIINKAKRRGKTGNNGKGKAKSGRFNISKGSDGRGKPRVSTGSDSDGLDLQNKERCGKSRIGSTDSDESGLFNKSKGRGNEGCGKSRTISTSSTDSDQPVDLCSNEGHNNQRTTQNKDDEVNGSRSYESDHFGTGINESDDEGGVVTSEVGVATGNGSDTEVNTGQIEADDHTDNENGCGQVVSSDTEAESSSPLNGGISPLAILRDKNISSSEISTDDVSLSDSDFMDDLRQKKVGKGTLPDHPSLPSRNDGSSACGSNDDVVSNSTCGSSSSTSEKKKRKGLSLKSRKSWHLSQSEYGTETMAKNDEEDEDGKQHKSASSETSGGENITATNTDTQAKHKKKKKKKASLYNGVDRYRDDESIKKKKPKTPAFISSDESGSPLLSKKKKHRDLFSSDEEDSNRLEALISSPEDDDDLFTSNNVQVTSIDNSAVEFHLNPISSDEDSDFDVSLCKKSKKRTVRLASLTSNTSSTTTCSNGLINDGNSSDDFEKSKKYRSAPPTSIINRAIQTRKRRRLGRKFMSDDNDSSGTSTSGERTPTNSPPLKDEEGSDSDVVEVKTPVKRKNIRKLLTHSKLTSETREAQKAEKERIERLRQRNKSLGEGTSDPASGQRIVLEENPANKDIKLEVRRELVSKVLPHQIKGMKFLYNSCCEDLDKLNNKPGSGAILAHCMGLGKTLQIIGFVDALLLHKDVTGVHRVLVLSPINTLLNWLDEWNKWIPVSLRKYRVCAVTDKTKNARLNNLERWYHMGGVIIVGYTMFRNLTLSKSFKRQKDQALALKYLCDPGADIVVCDEGHILRSEKSILSIAVNKVKTMRRIVLTGTPLQNNLMEYYTMCSFVKPNLLGTVKEFKNQFENPIKNGQHSDSLPSDVRKMKQRAHILHQLLKGCVDRRDYRILVEDLPPKHEYVVGIRMTPVQDQLIVRYLEKNSGYHTATDLFSTFANLLKVWNHPRVLELDQERKEDKLERKLLHNFINDDSDSLDNFIVDSRASTSSNNSTDLEIIQVDHSNGGLPHQGSKEDKKPVDNATGERSPSPSWYQDLLPDDCNKLISLSGKILFLLELLREVEKVGEKVLVFSQSLLVLDMIEEMLQLPECGRMMEGIHYFRLDGSTKAQDRRLLMKKFNKTDSSRLRLFLISTKAGSLGINLTGANRVVIFDACWNPTHDLQSIFRTYRFGQKKPVFVYRLVAKGTMEEKIYDRQVTKQSLSMRVVDEKQIGRHFSFSQLKELFVYTAPPPPPDTPPDTPYDTPESDIIFCNILDKLRPQCIVGYHTHDSLLEHIYDEELSEEEQKLAWENYNMQKEMDSREYNMAIQMQQNNTAQLLNPGMKTDFPGQSGIGIGLPGSSGIGMSLPGPVGMGMSLPGPSGMGMSLLGPSVMGMSAQGVSGDTTSSASNSNSASYLSIINHIKYAINLARQIKGLLALRNQLKDRVLDPANASVRRRYITAGSTLENRMAALNNSTMARIVSFSRNPELRSAILPLDLRNMDSLIGQFYDLKKEIAELANVPAPDHRELMAMLTTSAHSGQLANLQQPGPL